MGMDYNTRSNLIADLAHLRVAKKCIEEVIALKAKA